MTSTRPSRAEKVDAATPASRNRVVDFLRAAAITVVVLGHWTIIAVDPDGGILPHGVLDGATWTHPLTWLFQVMPIFFLVGGYSNGLSWRSARRKEIGYAEWLRARLRRLGLLVERDFGLSADRIELALGHPDMPGRLLLAVDTDGAHYVDTPSQRERDRLRAERLEAAGWATERVWSWALFIDPDGEAERIRRALDRALRLVQAEESSDSPSGVGTIRHRLPRPQIPAGHPLSFYSSDDFDAVVEYICSDGRARLEEHLATEVRSFLGFEQRSVLLDVSVSSAIRRYQERQ